MNDPINLHSPDQPSSWRLPLWVAFCIFAAIAIFFLWEEHRAHILGLLPYALLLACPLIHIFMHRGHGGGDHPHGHGIPKKEAGNESRQ